MVRRRWRYYAARIYPFFPFPCLPLTYLYILQLKCPHSTPRREAIALLSTKDSNSTDRGILPDGITS